MGRPDKTEERTDQILDAFARCIARSGVEQASLQDVADEAGVHKSIIRHYVGSRADLMTALSRRTIQGYREGFARLQLMPPGRARLDVLVDNLFIPAKEPYAAALFEALLRAPEAYPEANALWTESFDEIGGWLRQELRHAYPESTAEDRGVVAGGVWGLALLLDEKTPLEMLSPVNLKAAAQRLITSLGTTS